MKSKGTESGLCEWQSLYSSQPSGERGLSEPKGTQQTTADLEGTSPPLPLPPHWAWKLLLALAAFLRRTGNTRNPLTFGSLEAAWDKPSLCQPEGSLRVTRAKAARSWARGSVGSPLTCMCLWERESGVSCGWRGSSRPLQPSPKSDASSQGLSGAPSLLLSLSQLPKSPLMALMVIRW